MIVDDSCHLANLILGYGLTFSSSAETFSDFLLFPGSSVSPVGALRCYEVELLKVG